MLLSKCILCDIKKQDLQINKKKSVMLSKSGITTPLSKVPILCDKFKETAASSYNYQN